MLRLYDTMQLIRFNDTNFIPASHEDPKNPGVFKKILLQKQDLFVGKVQMINWAKLPAKSSFQPHYHQDMQEIFIIIKGKPIVEIKQTVSPPFLKEGKAREKSGLSRTQRAAGGFLKQQLYPGDTIAIDPNEIHLMRNPNNNDVEYIVVGIAGTKNGKTVVTNTT